MPSLLVRQVSIQNYKSVRKLSLELGRVNVLIGANGSGKSNMLEAIALGCARARDKLDHEYLAPRGVRIVPPRFMRSAFSEAEATTPVTLEIQVEGGAKKTLTIGLESQQSTSLSPVLFDAIRKAVRERVMEALTKDRITSEELKRFLSENPIQLDHVIDTALRDELTPDFVIFAPENSALRIFQSEPQILPLGAAGEGLYAHLRELSELADGSLDAIIDCLSLLDWFERLEIPGDLSPGERRLAIRDRYLVEGAVFDQRSANEGFLFLLFYLTLFVSKATPSFFAIDNIESSLNPKLATKLVRQLVKLAETHGKQVIFTTHSPSVLDGLELADDEQRLFVVDRGRDHTTRVRRVTAPKPVDGDAPVPLSEAFIRGYLGGVPKNF